MFIALSTSLKQQQFFFYLRKKRNHREVSLTKVTCKIIQNNFFLCRYKYCQSQVGSSDCGLVSLAFVYFPAKGEDPSNYTFNQGKTRNHLFKCILQGRITDFPVTRIGYQEKKKHTSSLEFIVYATCHTVAMFNSLLKCNKCISKRLRTFAAFHTFRGENQYKSSVKYLIFLLFCAIFFSQKEIVKIPGSVQETSETPQANDLYCSSFA